MKLLLEGWRGIGQSLAIVNQFQALALLRRGDVSLWHNDLPNPMNWDSTRNGAGLPAPDAARIAAIPTFAGEPVDAVYRIVSPTRAGAPDDKRRTVTFKVTEMGVDSKCLPPGTDLSFFTRDQNLVVTPTLWSADRLVEAGFASNRVRVIPHGADRELFFPLPANERATVRARLGFAEDDTVLLNIGGPFWNKGVDLLLEAFAILRARGRRVRLVLKDQSSLYGLGMQGMIAQIGARRPELLTEDSLAAITVFPGNFDFAQLRELYALADAYVSPYRAEGFNLPVLEAIACGVPVIVTSGGATDDFCPEPLATRIAGAAGVLPAQPGFPPPRFVEPRLDDLVEAMDRVRPAGSGRPEGWDLAREAVLSDCSWDRAAALLLECAGLKQAVREDRRSGPTPQEIRTVGMGQETRKAAIRRGADRRYATRWFVGDGIDIGCGDDSLGLLQSLFPLMRSVRPWDMPDGDAMLMRGVPDGRYDFVHSSHCLEHLVDPAIALGNWIRICRPGGTIVVTFPDEDLYEQKVWPSTFNDDHKWTFTIAKSASWSPRSVNVLELVGRFVDEVEIVKIELLDSGFLYGLPRQDQTRGLLSESAIEIVLRKRLRVAEPAIAPPDTQTLFAQAVAHHGEGRLQDASALYRKVLAQDPDDVAALNNLSLVAGTEEAEMLLRRAVELNPGYMNARLNLGKLLMSTGRPTDAGDCFLAMIQDGATQGQIYLELGAAFEAQDRNAEALSAYERALVLDPQLAEAAIRIGKLCEKDNRTQAAVAAYDRAIAVSPDHGEAHVQRGFALLKLGDYKRGSEGVAWIWRRQGLGYPADVFAAGADVSGRKIVLSADASLGDALMFVRYAGLLAARGARVFVECQEELVRLFAMQPDISGAVRIGAPLPTFDVRVPMHDLIRTFGTELGSIPAPASYLAASSAEAAQWRARLGGLPGVKVGLVWSGNRAHVHDARRSMDPDLLAPFRRIGGVSLVSLQKGAAWSDLPDFSAELTDMAATAALVEGLDLVVTVDTSMAHLAGAVGKPVWLLNRFDGCWRWLEDRGDSPWYPKLRQFRQRAAGDWAGVVAEASAALTAFAAEHNGGHADGLVMPHATAA